MGTIIKATGISTNKNIKSSNEHAIAAGLQCVENAGIDTKDIDLIINVGIYRDQNMVEPAMAAFIQKGIGIKNDYVRNQPDKAALSLDMMNSSCGIINAIQTADAIFKARHIKYAMIVSSDAHPSNKTNENFPFSSIGAAMLLEYSQDDQKGFKNFSFQNSENSDYSVRGYLDFNNLDEPAADRLAVCVPDEYNAKILEFASDSAEKHLTSLETDRKNVKLIPPQIYKGFGKKMAESLAIKDDFIPDLYPEYGNAHSSALTMAYHLASDKGFYNKNDQVIFVAAGAGLSAACATYTC